MCKLCRNIWSQKTRSTDRVNRRWRRKLIDMFSHFAIYTRIRQSGGQTKCGVIKALTKWNIAGGQCSDWRCWTLSLYLLTTSRCTDQWSVARVVVQTRWRCLVCCRPGSLLYTCRHQCLLDSAVQTVPTSDCHLYSNNTHSLYHNRPWLWSVECPSGACRDRCVCGGSAYFQNQNSHRTRQICGLFLAIARVAIMHI